MDGMVYEQGSRVLSGGSFLHCINSNGTSKRHIRTGWGLVVDGVVVHCMTRITRGPAQVSFSRHSS